jgi:hypothetical protein
MFKTFFPDQRSTPILGDYRRSLAFTQRSSGAILATMGDLQRFPKRHITLTRTSWCDGPISSIDNEYLAFITVFDEQSQSNLTCNIFSFEVLRIP